MRCIGWILLIVASLTILYNVRTDRDNERVLEEHPVLTLLSGGGNLKQAYSFTPPFTGFEITVMAAGVVGLVFVLFTPAKPAE